MDIIEMLRQRQLDAGLSNEKFGVALGLSGPTIWRYYDRSSKPDLAAYQKMVDYFARRDDSEMVGSLLTSVSGRVLDAPAVLTVGRLVVEAGKPT